MEPRIQDALKRAQAAAGPFPSICHPEAVWSWWSAVARTIRMDAALTRPEREHAENLVKLARR